MDGGACSQAAAEYQIGLARTGSTLIVAIGPDEDVIEDAVGRAMCCEEQL